ncbi:alpha/beta hydrolase [uncultured Jatrophihabitans sp.]|uniref:alpha/beta hydrolase n=1 Tax=uncultured Jatrophihabitans sp. TaxID=1610747 RepID=UPI0035CA6147
MGRNRRRVLGALGIAALLLGACTTTENGHGSAVGGAGSSAAPGRTSSGSTAQPPTRRATFTDCSDQFNLAALNLPASVQARLTFDCATLPVPLDYAQPNGRTISLQLVRVHDKRDTHPTGSLLVNPGGPGGSGVEIALGLTPKLTSTLLPHFDVVGFDPRGVGSSTPVSCVSDAQKDRLNAAQPDVRTKAGFAQAKALAATVARECESKYGSALAQIDTVQTAKDMDQIRKSVGDAKLNYLGFSYGTELGAQYAHLFPHNIRVMVLDGAVDPLTSDVTAFANQLGGFERAFDQFGAWCQKHTPCKSVGDPREAVYNIAAQSRANPIPAQGDSRRATSSLVYTGILSALYSQSQWPTLGQALLDAQHGNSEGLLTLADQYNERTNGQYSNLYDANTAISCNDSRPGPTDAQIRATAASWTKRFPIFGLWSAISLFSCQQWQPQRTVPPLPTARDASQTILVIGNLHDPATPYQGAKNLTRTLGKAELLSWDGEGHTSYLQGSGCVDGYVNSYLIDEKLPPQNKTCPR